MRKEVIVKEDGRLLYIYWFKDESEQTQESEAVEKQK
jgi:hypothetical protein